MYIRPFFLKKLEIMTLLVEEIIYKIVIMSNFLFITGNFFKKYCYLWKNVV